MTETYCQINDLDRSIAQRLQEFLPPAVVDAHAHVFRFEDIKPSETLDEFKALGPITAEVWKEQLALQVGPERPAGALLLPYPTVGCSEDRCNQWVIQQARKHPNCKASILVTPQSDRDKVLSYLDDPQVVGFKPYHVFSGEKPTFQSSIAGYLPEWAWQLADQRGLVITLHMVRDLALADPDNQQTIRTMCRKYPNARLILAHGARGFHAPNTVENIEAIKDLHNVWFDTSAVCESAPIEAILRTFGPRRLLWGSDFPISCLRGRCVTMGDGFVWLHPQTIVWEHVNPACRPILVGLESLRALKQACETCFLNRRDIEDIFADNALRLMGVKPAADQRCQDLYKHAKSRIPGGTQLLSKRPEMFAPNQWPAYFREARGCQVWDIDGRGYYDMTTNGIGACLLGYRDPDVTAAVQRRISLGSMSTLNPPEEVELADLLCEIHPWAQQARFCRTGGEAAAIAVRIARATTGRSLVAICGYHGWHDWYLAANLGGDDALDGHLLPGLDPAGVPAELRGTTLTFHYNNLEEFRAVLDQHGDRLAAVVMEPCRYYDPKPGFLQAVRDSARRCGAMLIFDEITIGFRLCLGGAHLKFGVEPDMAIFAKALGNGHPIAAVIGTPQAMEGAHRSFISSTYWTESVGPTAALAAVRKMQRIDVPAHIADVGRRVVEFWRQAADKHNLPLVADDGYPCLAHLRFEHELADEMLTLYTQLMLERGFLAGAMIYPTLAHTQHVLDRFSRAIDEVFAEISDAVSKNQLRGRLKGPVRHKGFARLT